VGSDTGVFGAFTKDLQGCCVETSAVETDRSCFENVLCDEQGMSTGSMTDTKDVGRLFVDP
jgi:hypothetical protein